MAVPPVQEVGSPPASGSTGPSNPPIGRQPGPSIDAEAAGGGATSSVKSARRAPKAPPNSQITRTGQAAEGPASRSKALGEASKEIESCSTWQGAQASLAKLTATAGVGNSPAGLEQLHREFGEFDDCAVPLMKVFVEVACRSDAPAEMRPKAVELANNLWSRLLRSGRSDAQHMRLLGNALSFIALDRHLNALGSSALPFVETALASADRAPANTKTPAQMQLIALCSSGAAHASSAADRLKYVQRAVELMDNLIQAGKTPPPACWTNVFEACWHGTRDANINPTARLELADRVPPLLDHMMAARPENRDDEAQPQSSTGGATVPTARDVLAAAVRHVKSCSDWQSAQTRLAGLLNPTDSTQQPRTVTPADLEQLHRGLAQQHGGNPQQVIKLFVEVACRPDAPPEIRSKALELAHESWSGLLQPGTDPRVARWASSALHDLALESHLHALGSEVLRFVDTALAWASHQQTRLTRQSRVSLITLCRSSAGHASSASDRLKYAENAVEMMDSVLAADNAPAPPETCWANVFQACWHGMRDNEIDAATRTTLTNHMERLAGRMQTLGQTPNATSYAMQAMTAARRNNEVPQP